MVFGAITNCKGFRSQMDHTRVRAAMNHLDPRTSVLAQITNFLTKCGLIEIFDVDGGIVDGSPLSTIVNTMISNFYHGVKLNDDDAKIAMKGSLHMPPTPQNPSSMGQILYQTYQDILPLLAPLFFFFFLKRKRMGRLNPM